MLRMDQVHVIRHKVLVEGVSQRQAAKQMGMSRNTVKKYVELSEPVVGERRPRKAPVLHKVQPRILELLDEWSSRTTRKQRITARRLHQQLLAEGFAVGETTVRAVFREWRRLRDECFVPLVHRSGDEAQVDFFEVTVDIKGERVKRWMFLMRLMCSGRDFTWIYEHCDQASFFDGHVRAFAHFGGVPARCVYDNLSAAVRRVMFPGRELTQRFMALSSHYLFEPCFARVGTGHDKGGVEARGKGIRLQHLVPIPRGESLDAIAEALLASVDDQARHRRDRQGETVMARFEAERADLHPLPEHAFEPRLAELLTASRKALVTCQGATYSLPSHWRLLDVTAYVGPIDVRFMCRGEVQVRRRVLRREKNIQYKDYLVELSRKPQAVRQVAPELMAELGEPFATLWSLLDETHGGREAGRILARVLSSVVQHGADAVGEAVSKALDGGQRHLLQLAALEREPLPAAIEVPESLAQYVVEAASAADFDGLLQEASS
jgi:transposase